MGLTTEESGFGVWCRDEGMLHAWLKLYLGMDVPRRRVCEGHCAPFDYLCATYFEPAKDLVVWAPRGGGKTRLGAVATLLDMVHKPGVRVRILGGSMEQSEKMWGHLVPALWPYMDYLGEAMARWVRLGSGSECAVLAQSERSVRGVRVQKMRCDEVELFDPGVWEAAQLAVKSRQLPVVGCPLPAGRSGEVRGTIEALSTLHRPFGLMGRVVDEAGARGARVIKWCLLEVLERCPEDRQCEGCPLWEECQGRAKHWEGGYVSIDDAIAMKGRVSKETWEAEMLCRRPSVKGVVFPTFDRAVHVKEELPVAGCELPEGGGGGRGEVTLAIDFGFAAPFVCLWVKRDGTGRTYIIDEYVQPGRTIEEHVAQIEGRAWGARKTIACDPAGSAASDQTAQSNVQYLRSRGYGVKYSKSLIVDGLEKIRAALRPGYGEAKLYVHPRCGRLIEAFGGYRYAEGGSELPVKDGRHDHLIDALRYHFVNAGRLEEARPPRSY